MEEVSPEIQKSVRAALGERFHHGLVKKVQVETKGEKTDEKILALKNCRAFILSSKNPPKLEHEFNYLEIELIESAKPKQVKLKLQDRKDAFLVTAASPEDATSIIEFIAESLKRVFPHTSLESFFDVKLEPADRLERLQTHLDCFSLPDLGPCGGFSQMYQFMCDLHSQPYMEEVAWDIDTIYLSQDSTELSLNDFDHLEAKDLVPILASLMYNSWFKRLTVKDIKLTVEATKEVINVIKKSSSLEQLVLNNAGFKSEFGRDVAVALHSNSSSALVLLDLSNNHLEDKGVKSLCPALAKLQNGLIELSLANNQVTAEGVSTLGKALSENNFFPTSLMKLNLSRNPLKEGNIENLLNFLAQPNHVTHLDLSECGIALDSIFSALFRGCVNLTHVNFSGNVYTHKKAAKDVTVPKAVKQFFATTTKLQHFNVANCKLLPEAIKELLLGIGSNRNLESVELNLASNDLRSEGAKVIASCIANVPNITSLNLSNNDLCLDMANLIVWIGQNKVLSELDLSENLTNLRQKNLSTVLDAIVELIQDEASPIRSLSLAKNKLKFETIPIINALGSNTTLTSIDISGNLMGDIGARMLAKALQINCKLERIVLDSNNISPKGFQDIADALERNYSLKSIPPPMSDLSSCLKSGGGSDKAEAAFQQIQSLLQRNHSPHKFAGAQAFRLQQGFLYTTSHQLVDKLVVQIQDACKELKDCEEEDVQENIVNATGFIKDADNSKQLLETLHEESRKNESDDVTQQLKEMAAQIQSSAEEKLKKTAEGMIEGTKEKCPHVMENEELKQNVIAVCKNRGKIPDKFVLSLIEQLNEQLSNQMSEANLAMAAHISDTIIDEIIEMLMNSHQKMAKHLSKYRNRTLSLSLPMVNGPTSSDTTDSGGTTVESPENVPHYVKRDGEGAPSKTDLRDKRKSVKVRPKSTIIRAQDVTTPVPAVEEPGTSTPERLPTVSTATSIPQKRKEISKEPSAPAPNINLRDFDAVSSSSQRPLRDARQDRPRRPRNVRPTRAVAVAQTETNPGHSKEDNDGDVKDVGKGVEEFFQSKVEPAFAITPVKGKEQSSVKEPKKEKKDKDKEKEKDKKKDKKEKKEEKKPKEEAKKKKGMFGGLFAKKRGSQPQITPEKETPSPRRASEPATKVKEVAKPSPQADRKLKGVAEEEVPSGSQTPEYRSSEDELSVKDEIDGRKEEKEKVEEKKDEEPVEEKKPLPVPAKRALKPGGGNAPFSPSVLAEMKVQQANRKSKEILEPVQSNGTTDTPKKEDKPLPPVKLPAAESGDKDEIEKEKEKTSPTKNGSPVKEKETPDEPSTPEENGEVPEKTPSPKKTSTGQFVLPPSPAKRNISPQSSVKTTTDSAEAVVNDKKETPQGEPDKQETPKGDTASEPTASPELPREQTPPSAAKEEETPAEEDHAASGASSPKSSPSAHAASRPAISLTIDTESSGEAKKASPVSPHPHSPLKSPSSPSTSPHDSQPPPQPSSPSKIVNPLFVPKKGASFQEKPSKDEIVLQKKSASIGARPVGKGDQGGKADSGKGVPEKQVIKEIDPGKQNGGPEKNGEEVVVEKEDEVKKTESPENEAEKEDDSVKEKSRVQTDKNTNDISAEPDEQPKRSGSVSERMKNFEKPEASPEQMTLDEKRKSFEKKDPPVAAPRPVSMAPKPVPRPKPTVAKRPLSGDKNAPPVKSPPGSVSKKPPPVAAKRPVVKP